jgi:hypothetical protein
MNTKQFHITYFIIITTLKLSIICLFLLWAIDSYYLIKSSGLIEAIKSFSDFNKLSVKLESAGIKWLWSIFYLVIKIVVLKLVSYTFRHAPTPMKWLKKWDDNGEISTILGKKITYHLRFNNNVSFEDFIILKSYATSEKTMLNHQSEDEIKKHFFLKYDSSFNEDLN